MNDPLSQAREQLDPLALTCRLNELYRTAFDEGYQSGKRDAFLEAAELLRSLNRQPAAGVPAEEASHDPSSP